MIELDIPHFDTWNFNTIYLLVHLITVEGTKSTVGCLHDRRINFQTLCFGAKKLPLEYNIKGTDLHL